MKASIAFSFLLLLGSAAAAHADYVILRDGKSYSGAFSSAPNGKLSFQDTSGIQYTFPVGDIRSVVFSNTADHITLHGEKSYSGKLLGLTRVSFQGANGVSYVFPVNDISSIIFTGGTSAAVKHKVVKAAAAVVIPSGAILSVRTDVPIDTSANAASPFYPAQIQRNIVGSTGAVAIPAGTPAKLQVFHMGQGGDGLGLGLYSVLLDGKEYRVDSSSITEDGSADFGLNRRTALYTGGGAGLGALLGGVFGGGNGAGIGALGGGAVGALTQYLTSDGNVSVPAGSPLTFQLQQTLVLHP